jgi:CheY-like chemotaxis protein
VRGDASRFRQVLLNLIGNAIKFTSQGGVIVQIDRDSATEESVVLRSRVTDSGIGIAAAVQDSLFQPFVQGDASTTRLFGGTGLGLAISRKLVHMMGGEISVDSEPECGSSFSFTACFERAAGAEEIADECSVHPRVLIVDDSPTTRQLMALQLSAFGIPNEMADDSITALSMLREAAAAGVPYDVILSDLNMPHTNGVALARLVKANPALRNPRFILITASAPRIDVAALQESGISAFLTKPIRRHHLFSALLGDGPVETPAPEPAPQPRARNTDEARRRILVVDDSAVNQVVATHQLEKLGFAADAASNGLEALDALERVSYDAVLMDCQMPEMDGLTATRLIRTREKGTSRRTKIIALTASATASDRQQCLDAGMDGFVTKPTKEENLAQVLGGLTAA